MTRSIEVDPTFGEDLKARGAIQLSRKYRMVGVPPVGDPLENLRALDPEKYALLIERASKDAAAHLARMNTQELTPNEFNSWLVANGMRPVLTSPPGVVCEHCRTWTGNHARDCPRRRRTNDERNRP